MKKFTITSLAALCCLMLLASLAGAEEILTNRSVERMVAAGLSPEIITAKITSTPGDYDVSIDAILELKKKGIPDAVIKAMVNTGNNQHQEPAADQYQPGGQNGYSPANEYYQPQSSYSGSYQTSPRHRDPVAGLLKDIEEAKELKAKRDYTWKSKAHAIALTLKNIYPANTHNIKYWWAYTQYSVLVEKEHHILKGIKKVLYFDPYHVEALILKGDTNFAAAKRLRPGDDENAGLSREDMEYEARKAYDAALAAPKITAEQKARVSYQLGEMAEIISQSEKRAKRHWQKAIDAAPASTWADLARQRLGSEQEPDQAGLHQSE